MLVCQNSKPNSEWHVDTEKNNIAWWFMTLWTQFLVVIKVHKASEKWACKYYTTYYPKTIDVVFLTCR